MQPLYAAAYGHVNARSFAQLRTTCAKTLAMFTDEKWRERLLEAIERSDLPDRQIGIRARCGASWVSDFKNGKKPPKLETFLKICAVLNVSPAYILTGVPITPRTERIIRGLLALSEQSQMRLEAFVQSLADEDGEPPLLP